MLIKSGLFLFLFTVLQVSARYKSVEPDFNENEIIPDPPLSSSSRIISGWLAQPGQFPYHASLRLVNANGLVRQCGGSIVSREWVISSAFCTVSQVRAMVYAGLVSHTNPEYLSETREWYTHPLYNTLRPNTLQRFDISLVKLQRPVVYTRLLQPIRVQSRADAYRNYNGQQVIATGHGNTANSGPVTDELRWVYLRAIANNVCATRYLFNGGVFDTTICAQFFNVTSQATCYGDNGGPLVHVGSDGVPTLIGVSYFFSIGCDRNLPSAFTRTGPFLSWFLEVTGIDFENIQEHDVETTTSTSTSSTTTPITTTTDGWNPDDLDDFTAVESTTATLEQEPDDLTPKETTIATPEDSEDIEEEKEDEDDLDSSESNEDDEMAQLLKRLQVNVKVKIRFDKYNVTKAVGNEINIAKH